MHGVEPSRDLACSISISAGVVFRGSSGVGTSTPRPAGELVRGGVTFVGLGWVGFRRVLDPDEVATIADDLELVLAEADPTLIDCRFDGATGYVHSYLTVAREFTRSLVARGEGLVYLIG